jgi:small subunit ribosomal protein S5
MVKAVFHAFENMASPRYVAARRGRKVSDILGRRDQNSAHSNPGAVASLSSQGDSHAV